MVEMHEGRLPHIYWIDLKQDGVFVECAVMKKDGLGNVFFFPLSSLDDIDKRRLSKIVNNRNAIHFELWDLMSNITLNNGVNALDYFHQLVQVITPSGRIMRPQLGQVGVGKGAVDTRGADYRRDMEEGAAAAAKAAATAAAEAAANAVRSQSNPQPAPQAEAPAPVKKTTRKKTSSKKEEGDDE